MIGKKEGVMHFFTNKLKEISHELYGDSGSKSYGLLKDIMDHEDIKINM
jgi:hypothetical protein